MRIAFIAGELAPGLNGVGDYTRRIAAACAAKGHNVCLLSLAERITPGPMEEQQSCDGVVLPTLRLGMETWRADRGQRARDCLRAFRADWVSLQFVPYSFHPRGFFGPSVNHLVETFGGLKSHVFFHEIWIGSYLGAPFKERVFGWWQRVAVQRLLRELRPTVVHTSNAYYCQALAGLGQEAEILPMFGGVPRMLGSNSGRTALMDAVPKNALVCGMFGSLHPHWEAEPFFTDFLKLAASIGRPAALVSVGAMGAGEGDFDRLAREWAGRIALVKLGRCSTEEISHAFQRFDFAVTSVPWNILGKSSSVAALREHGLRVVVTNAGRAARFSTPEKSEVVPPGYLLHFRDRGLAHAVLSKTHPESGLDIATERLLAALSCPSKNA